jgi:hypothetical protein
VVETVEDAGWSANDLLLRVEPDELDLERFRRLQEEREFSRA